MQPWNTLSASLQLGILTEGWNLATLPAESTEDARIFRSTISFATPFEAPPVVHIGLTAFDMDQRDSNRLSVSVGEITTTGFDVEVATWRDTRVYSIGLSWLALGA